MTELGAYARESREVRARVFFGSLTLTVIYSPSAKAIYGTSTCIPDPPIAGSVAKRCYTHTCCCCLGLLLAVAEAL